MFLDIGSLWIRNYIKTKGTWIIVYINFLSVFFL